MTWVCPECGEENKDELVRCICGYEEPHTKEKTSIVHKILQIAFFIILFKLMQTILSKFVSWL
ncbi:hypothetical protein [Desulforapulum autotrophicum]|uniref:hypothetical protein n=1 Tax=Desulforapulum autotrophicum TaxID=2296 RepID=UPI00059DB25D|nr:hypothetical protein [Desulforapulum autotrophicum]